MRTKNQILKLKKTHSSPFVIKDIPIDPKEYLNILKWHQQNTQIYS